MNAEGDHSIYEEVKLPEMQENQSYGCVDYSKKKTSKTNASYRKIVLTLAVAVIVAYALLCSIAILIAFVEIAKLKSDSATLQQEQSAFNNLTHQLLQNETDRLRASAETVYMQLMQAMQDFLQLENTMNSLENMTTQKISKLRQDILQLENYTINTTTQKFSQLENQTSRIESFVRTFGAYNNPVSSCTAVYPFSPPGYYWIKEEYSSTPRSVYCDITSCGGVTGVWRRLAYLDMTNSRHRCPSNLIEHNFTNKRTCVKSSVWPGCVGVIYSSSQRYSHVCGRIKAYQVGSTNAFGSRSEDDRANYTVRSAYVDGIVLSSTSDPPEHLWTFAAAVDEGNNTKFADSRCVCSQGSGAISPPAFVGDNYFCDTGSSQRVDGPLRLYADPLWDGAGCGSGNTCCSFHSPPWFYKQLAEDTHHGISMDVCRDEYATNEDIAIEMVEIYVM